MESNTFRDLADGKGGFCQEIAGLIQTELRKIFFGRNTHGAFEDAAEIACGGETAVERDLDDALGRILQQFCGLADATVGQILSERPGKPYASATFGDDPFCQATALRKPTGKTTLDATRLYLIFL